MSDELLPYYNNELAYIRKLGHEFAQAHPKIASRLRLDADGSHDPHVARLIEAFAFLNARLRHKLDDDFPELSEALLGILYPHYLAPIPSAAIAQFSLDRHKGQLSGGYLIRSGETVETEPVEGQPCRFHTRYPVTLWPLELQRAELRSPPLVAPTVSFRAEPTGVLRLRLQSFSEKIRIGDLKLDRLRFFLRGQTPFIYDLYELLLNNVLGIVVAQDPGDRAPVVLPPDSIQPVGFGSDEGLWDYPARSFRGYRLLSEFFAFPEKFLFLDFAGLTPDVLADLGQTMELFVYVRKHSQNLEKHVTRETFQLGCSPMVNLFAQRAEPIALTHTRTEYHVIPDARRPRAHEVYSLNRVVATSPDGETKEFLPFFSVKHGQDLRDQRTFWHATRRRAQWSGGQVDHGTEVYLTLVDLDFQPSAPSNWTIDVETTCLNRDLPHGLPFGGGRPHMQLVSADAVARTTCLTAPTPTRRPVLRHGTVWRLISHLSLNHLSLADGSSGADALREILRLYDFADSQATRDMIEGVYRVHSARVVGRVSGAAASGFCRGLEVALDLDEEKFTGGGVFLFASVLERFLGLYTSINSFTKTTVRTNKREEPLHRWPPRAGEQVLL
jgi:type VI secretion system protein ImpG